MVICLREKMTSMKKVWTTVIQELDEFEEYLLNISIKSARPSWLGVVGTFLLEDFDKLKKYQLLHDERF